MSIYIANVLALCDTGQSFKYALGSTDRKVPSTKAVYYIYHLRTLIQIYTGRRGLGKQRSSTGGKALALIHYSYRFAAFKYISDLISGERPENS